MLPSRTRHGTGYAVRNVQRGGIIFRLLFLMTFLVFLFFLYLVRHPLLRVAGEFWVVDDGPVASDAIAMLGDDNYAGDRATRAAELLKMGWAPRVIASGRFLRPYASVAALEEHDLMDRGVPKSAIFRFEHSATDTREEAIDIGRLMAEHGWKRIIVVTSNYHTRRARYIFERALPPGTVLRVVPAADSEYDPRVWWQHRQSLKLFAHEFVGMFVAMWEMRHEDARAREAAWLPVW